MFLFGCCLFCILEFKLFVSLTALHHVLFVGCLFFLCVCSVQCAVLLHHRWSVCLLTTLCCLSAARHFAFWPYFSGHVVFLPVSRNARQLCAFRFVVCICSFASRFGWLCLSGHFPLSWVYSWSSAATKLMAWARVQRLMQFFSWTFSFFNS